MKGNEINIHRDGYAEDSLFKRMKIRQTNANINDLKDTIENTLVVYKDKNMIGLYALFITKIAGTRLLSIKKPSPERFE